jgi:hypothetical protein
MAKRPVTTADVLVGHVSLDLECLDRIYLNGYVPNLQVGGQVVQFLAMRGFPIPSPVVVGRIGDQFRRSVRSFADINQIPMIKFGKGERKIERMRRYLARQAATGQSGVAAIGWAQEFQRVATCTTTEARNGGTPNAVTLSCTIPASSARMSSVSASPRARRSAVAPTTSIIMIVSAVAALLGSDKVCLPVSCLAAGPCSQPPATMQLPCTP